MNTKRPLTTILLTGMAGLVCILALSPAVQPASTRITSYTTMVAPIRIAGGDGQETHGKGGKRSVA